MKKTSKGMLSHFAGSSKHKRKYSDKDVEDMRNRRLKGETFESIAKDYGITRSAIAKAIQRHNPILDNSVLPKGYIHISDYCALNGLNYNTVVYHIRAKNIPVIKHKNKVYIKEDTVITNDKFIDDDKIEDIHRLKNKGLNKTQIAAKLGLNRKTVAYYYKD